MATIHALSGGGALIDVDIVGAILASDLVGGVSLLALLIISVQATVVVVRKHRALNLARYQNAAFLRACESDGLLETGYAEACRFLESPLARLYSTVYSKVFELHWFRDFDDLEIDQHLAIAQQWIQRSIDKAVLEEIARLEKNMIMLGTVSTICPFIGLFGTVWGVLAAFQNIAAGGLADLTMLAPGISTALTTTIGGLIPAIPSVVAYNSFQTQINHLVTEMESYGLDLQAHFQSEIVRRKGMRAGGA